MTADKKRGPTGFLRWCEVTLTLALAYILLLLAVQLGPVMRGDDPPTWGELWEAATCAPECLINY